MDNKKKADKSETTQTNPPFHYSRKRHPPPIPPGLSDNLLPGLQPTPKHHLKLPTKPSVDGKRRNHGPLIIKGGKRKRKDKQKIKIEQQQSTPYLPAQTPLKPSSEVVPKSNKPSTRAVSLPVHKPFKHPSTVVDVQALQSKLNKNCNMNNEELNKLQDNFAMLQQDNEKRTKAEELRLKKQREYKREYRAKQKKKWMRKNHRRQ